MYFHCTNPSPHHELRITRATMALRPFRGLSDIRDSAIAIPQDHKGN